MIPASVLITTYNEEERLPACLRALKDFDEVIVIDSHSTDRTRDIASANGAKVILFQWNGQYPKKRQWCLDHIQTKYDYIFFLDADEIMTESLSAEMTKRGLSADGYFVRSRPVWRNKPLRHGLANNKLCLFHRDKFSFPEVADLPFKSMGEMEGHYQPVAKDASARLDSFHAPLQHLCEQDWQERHQRYAAWEASMIAHRAYPTDPNRQREFFKMVFRALPRRDLWMFCYAYIIRGGFRDGRAGLHYARAKASYYGLIDQHRRAIQ